MPSRYTVVLISFLPFMLFNLGMIAIDQSNPIPSAPDTLKRIDGMAIDTDRKIVRYFYHQQRNTVTGTPAAIAEQFLRNNQVLLGIKDPVSQLVLKRDNRTPAGHHLIYQQHIDGIPVHQGDLTITVSNEGHVAFVANRFRPDLYVQNLEPSFDRTTALKIAEEGVKPERKFPFDPEIELMVMERGTGHAILIYRVRFAAEVPRGDWEVLLDANTGAVLQFRNRIMYDTIVNGSGAVWDPDPLTSAGVYYGGNFEDPGGYDLDRAELNAQRVIAPLREITERNGKYYLEGPFVRLFEFDPPVYLLPTPIHPDSFIYTRSQQSFEAVMVYYHIDSAGRYIQSMGYDIPGLWQIRADPHGANGEDNSYYMGSGNFCAFGEGGVDDAEDAAVIWHEYAHAIQENIAGMTYTGETASLQEGCSDYWAASYLRSITDFNWRNLFIWDAGKTGPGDSYGVFWQGRRCDLDLRYPEDYDFQPGIIHKNGQIWSSALMHVQEDIGREITDNVFIQAHYLWGPSPGLQDAARALIQADSLLYQGVHTRTIIYWLEQYGLIQPENYMPLIIHQPLRDTEEMSEPIELSISILSKSVPLDSSSVCVFWDSAGAAPADSVNMTWNPDSGSFQASLAGPERPALYRYYFQAKDDIGRTARLPANAPDSAFTVNIGPDLIAPYVWHESIANYALVRWPPTVLAYARDNMGIDSIFVEFGIDSAYAADRFPLLPGDLNDWYQAPFPGGMSEYLPGQYIYYRFLVEDVAALKNVTFLPDSGFFAFKILGDGGEIVLDSEVDYAYFTGYGDWENGKPVNGPGAAFAGNSVWATGLNNAYSVGPRISSIISSPIALTGFSHATLSFWQWYAIEPHLDGGNVKITTDQGMTWKLLVPSYGYDTMADGNFGNPVGREAVFSGENKRWHKVYFDLEDYTGKEIHLKFDFGSDISGVHAGWFLDSLKIFDGRTSIERPRQLGVVDNRQVVSLVWQNINPNIPDLPPSPYQQDEYTKISFLQYYIYRSESTGEFDLIDSTLGSAYPDSLVVPGRTYQYFIRAGAGNLTSQASDTISVFVQPVTGLLTDSKMPDRFALFQNFPNPFNPVTRIKYQIPVNAHVGIKIFDINGKLIKILVNKTQHPGSYEVDWNSDNPHGQRVASGIYLVQMEAGSFRAVRKIVLLK